MQASACNVTKINTPPWMFFAILNCTNGTKSRNPSHMVKLESGIVVPSKPKPYRRHIHDVFIRRKFIKNDIPLERLYNYYPKIKLIIALNLKKFLGTKLICVNDNYNTMPHRKWNKLLIGCRLKYLNAINVMPLVGIYIN